MPPGAIREGAPLGPKNEEILNMFLVTEICRFGREDLMLAPGAHVLFFIAVCLYFNLVNIRKVSQCSKWFVCLFAWCLTAHENKKAISAKNR